MAAAGQRVDAAAAPRRDERPLAEIDAGLDPSQGFGEPPVNHQRLAVLADNHVAGLDITMQYPAAVGIIDRIADVGKPAEKFAQLERPAARVARGLLCDRAGLTRSSSGESLRV